MREIANALLEYNRNGRLSDETVNTLTDIVNKPNKTNKSSKTQTDTKNTED